MDVHKPKFCGKCGVSLSDHANFCVECGFPVERFTTTSQDDHYESKSGLERSTKRKRSTIKKIGIIMAVIIISLIIMSAIASITAEDQNPLRYEGLTQSQVTIVRIIEDQCKQGAINAYSQSGATLEEIYTKKCNQVVEDKISQYREENTITNAIETRNVSLCENVPNNLICIKDYALALNEPNVCSSAGHVESSCIIEVAKKYNQIETCDLLTDNTQCIYQFAYSNNNSSICEKATNQKECVKSFAFSIGTSGCELLEGEELKSCYLSYLNRGLSVDEKLASDCVNPAINNEFDRWSCRIKAIGLGKIPREVLLSDKIDEYGGIGVCRTIGIPQGPAETSNDQCLASLAVFYNDYSMCDQIKNDDRDFRSVCYGTIAFTNDSVNSEMCVNLTDPSLCYVGIAYRLNDDSICNDWENLKIRDAEQFRNQCIKAIQERNKS